VARLLQPFGIRPPHLVHMAFPQADLHPEKKKSVAIKACFLPKHELARNSRRETYRKELCVLPHSHQLALRRLLLHVGGFQIQLVRQRLRTKRGVFVAENQSADSYVNQSPSTDLTSPLHSATQPTNHQRERLSHRIVAPYRHD
jgi:hypothetical protein